jgi:hypothetical protein
VVTEIHLTNELLLDLCVACVVCLKWILRSRSDVRDYRH